MTRHAPAMEAARNAALNANAPHTADDARGVLEREAPVGIEPTNGRFAVRDGVPDVSRHGGAPLCSAGGATRHEAAMVRGVSGANAALNAPLSSLLEGRPGAGAVTAVAPAARGVGEQAAGYLTTALHALAGIAAGPRRPEDEPGRVELLRDECAAWPTLRPGSPSALSLASDADRAADALERAAREIRTAATILRATAALVPPAAVLSVAAAVGARLGRVGVGS